MYLIQAALLKKGRPPSGNFRFPSLEWLERVNSRTIQLSLLFVTGGFVSGILLNRLHGRLPWTDPAVAGLTLMVAWLFAAGLFNAIYRPARRGRKVAYLTVAGFVFLLISLATLFLSESQHVMSQGEASARILGPGSQPCRLSVLLPDCEFAGRSCQTPGNQAAAHAPPSVLGGAA
jgi:peptidoglycan/LPS O-acetylase OafA/YrhL